MPTTMLSKSEVRDPECPVVQSALVAPVTPRVFDSLRTVTNAIFYHLSFNCQAKSLVKRNLSPPGVPSRSGATAGESARS
jgi:hypothetical protein